MTYSTSNLKKVLLVISTLGVANLIGAMEGEEPHLQHIAGNGPVFLYINNQTGNN